MASKLLNVLQDIETGRQECINTLWEKGSELVNRNSSIIDINEAIDSLSVVGGQPYIEIPGKHNYAGYTKETDPDLWHRPAHWPDIKAIIDDEEPIEVDGYTYMPHSIYLFLNDTATKVNLRVIVNDSNSTIGSAQNRLDLEDGDFIIGAWGYTNNVLANDNYNKAFHVKTSDGASYTFRTALNDHWADMAQEHTWDTTRDIEIDNDKFRYIIVYERESTNTTYQGAIDFTKTPNIVEASICTNRTTYYVNVSLDLLNLMYLIPQKNTGVLNIQYNYLYLNYSNAASPAYRLTNIRKYTQYDFPAFLQFTGYNTLRKLTQVDMPLQAFSGAWSYMESLLSVRTKYFSGFYASSGVTSQGPLSPVRYIEVVDTEYQQTHYSNVAGLAGLDNVVEENFTQYITGITMTNNNYNAIQGSFEQRGVLELPNLVSVNNNNALKGIRAKHVYLPKWTGGFVASDYSSFTELTIGCPFSASLTLPSSIKKIHMLEATDGSNVTFGSAASWGRSLEYLDLPKATALYTGFFSNLLNLRYVKLPIDFKFNVNLNNLKYITKQCVLDLFQRCAELEEGESFTITLTTNVRAQLTDEEIAVATDKGWTVA